MNDAKRPLVLPILPVSKIKPQTAEQAWLIKSIWARYGVGIIGGAPKCCKSWLGLDMALSVASGTPCLDRFPVEAKGPALIYLAEDAAGSIRNRLDALCVHRRITLDGLPLYAITAPLLRLDQEAFQKALQKALAHYKPSLLLLDPLVRLHRLDENSAAEISGLLGFLRECQRTYRCAVVLVHHASKKQRAQPGQALRGSSDLHAFGDSNAYLARNKNRLTLTLEHRSARPPDPFMIELKAESDGSVHLALAEAFPNPDLDLPQRVLALLRHRNRPMPANEIRAEVQAQGQRLANTLKEMAAKGLIHQPTRKGWVVGPTPAPIR